MKWTRTRTVVLYTVVVFLSIAVLMQRGCYKGGAFDGERFNDFRAYHTAAESALGGDLTPAYEDRSRPLQYPPPFSIFVLPFGLVPYRVGVLLWVVLNGLLAVVVFRSLDSALGLPLSAEAKLGGFFLALRPLESDFSNGNANTLVLAVVLLGFALLRKRRVWSGGAVLAVACLSKATPLLFAAWALLRKRWRVLGALAVGLIVLGVLLPVVVFGPTGARDAWSEWVDLTLTPVVASAPSEGAPLADGEAPRSGDGYMPGQGLRAFVHRILRDSDATAHDDVYRSVHLASLSARAADGVYVVLALLLCGGVYVALRLRSVARLPGWAPVELASVCVLMAVLGPLSRKAHFVLLWPAAVLAFDAWWRIEGRQRRVGACLWGLALVLLAGTSPGVVGRDVSTTLLAYCPFTWAAFCLLVLLTYPGFYPRTHSPRAITPDCGSS